MFNSTFRGENEWEATLTNDMDITLAGSHQLEFPLLSEKCVSPNTPWPEDPLVDNLTLNKSSQKKDQQEKTKKNPADIMIDTETLLKFYMKQSKHQRAIQNELKGLLEHEKNILEQLVERSTKFTELKEENKKRQDEWESQHKDRMPFYSKYLTQLMEIPEAQGLAQEGIPGEVQQRMLYNIVDSTSNVANNAIVQLSVQNTLVNDVDLSLTKLKQFCSLMLKYIENWMKSLSTQIPNSKRVRDQWAELNLQIEKLKTVPAEEVIVKNGITAADFHKEMAKINDRISKIEQAQELLMGKGGEDGCEDEYLDMPDSSDERRCEDVPLTCPRRGNDAEYESFQPRAYSSPTEGFQDFRSCPNRSRYQKDPSKAAPSRFPSQVQEDIKKLEEMNKTLQGVADQYRTLKDRLLKEIDKVLNLNHKLQKDLQNMANK